ncbi:MAG: cation transporting ATPase C-terminal domain-containing protein [Dongiaceae bacterium]
MRLIERFMLVFGPLSSVFDFLTFGALLWLLRAGEAEFQTGWFVESLASQILVIFVIRTRRSLFASRPHPLLTWLSLGLVAAAAALPFTPVAGWFGFVPLPPVYFSSLPPRSSPIWRWSRAPSDISSGAWRGGPERRRYSVP